MREERDNTAIYVTVSILLVLALFVFIIFIWPMINVWRAGMVGRATLQHADFERQVQVVNAQANLQAQKYNAQAEVARAGGVAQANNIIKNSITDDYIRYLWVKTLEDSKSNNQIIYVPTEMGLPITEASRLSTPTK